MTGRDEERQKDPGRDEKKQEELERGRVQWGEMRGVIERARVRQGNKREVGIVRKRNGMTGNDWKRQADKEK